MQESSDRRRYRAFISYSHKDAKWANWLHRSIETYRTPKQLIGRDTPAGPVPKRLTPVFRDRDELASSADLGEAIRTALSESDYLVVICSPEGATSPWVNEEILTFKRAGGVARTLAFIVSGEPSAVEQGLDPDEECFPEALRFELDAAGELTDVRAEPVAADARPTGDGKNDAKVKLLAGLLGVGFDDLKQRESQRRQRRLAAFAAVSLTALVITSGLAIAAVLARNEAVVQRTRAEQEAETATRSTDFLVSLFENANPYATQGKEVSVRRLLEIGAEKIETDLEEEPEIRGRLSNVMGRAYGNLGDFETAADLFSKAAKAHGESKGLDERADNLTLKANMLANQNKFDEAVAEGEQAIALRRELRDAKPLAVSLYGHAQTLARIDRNEEADRLFQEAIATFRDLDEHPESPHYANAMTAYANHLLGKKTDASDRMAESLFVKSLEIRARVQGPNNSSRTYDLHGLAEVLENRGDLVGAEKNYRESLRIDEIVYKGEHAYVAEDLAEIGRILDKRGETKQAEAMLLRALEMRRRVSKSPEDVAQSHFMLGAHYRKSGRLVDAEQHLREAVRIDEKAFGSLHRKVCGDLEALTRVLLAQREATEAITVATRAEAACAASYPASHWRTASVRSLLGEATGKGGDPEAAEKLLLDSFAALDQGDGHSRGAREETRRRLAELYRSLGEDEKARAYSALHAPTETAADLPGQ